MPRPPDWRPEPLRHVGQSPSSGILSSISGNSPIADDEDERREVPAGSTAHVSRASSRIWTNRTPVNKKLRGFVQD